MNQQIKYPEPSYVHVIRELIIIAKEQNAQLKEMLQLTSFSTQQKAHLTERYDLVEKSLIRIEKELA